MSGDGEPERLQAGTGASLTQVVNMLYSRQKLVSPKLGSPLGQMPLELRIAVKLIDATLAVMHQAIADGFAGTVPYNDATLQARLDAAIASAFTPEPPQPDPPILDVPITP